MPSLADAVRRLHRSRRPGAVRTLPPLILMTDRWRLADPEAAIRALPRGSAVILRDYDAADRAARARRLADLCRLLGVRLLVGGDWRLARTVDAAGLHLTETAVRQGAHGWHGRLPPDALVTAAAHDPTAIRRAMRLGCDAVLLSPVFPTASHPDAPALGAVLFARWTRASPLPVYALGGVSGDSVRRLSAAGAVGFAAIGALAAGSSAPSA